MPRTESPDKWRAMRKPKAPGKSRSDILAAAADEFARHGFNGSRLEAIAARTRTTRAMIYYYFRNREGLYRAVLEEAYRDIRTAEAELDLAHMEPVAAMRRLVEFVFDYYQRNPSFVALVVAENQAGGRHIHKVHRMQSLNVSIIGTLRDILLARVPVILRADVYATAALAGAVVMIAARKLGAPPAVAALAGGLTCFVLRIVAVWQHWALPRLPGTA